MTVTTVHKRVIPGGIGSDAVKVIFASSLGTVFEWYDFYLYGSLATIISKQFFSGANETAGFIFALLAFAAGFGKSVGLKAKDVNPYSNYGATATLTLLKAVANSDGTRASVTANLFKTVFTDSPVGPFKLNKNGDTNAAPISFYAIKGGQAVFSTVINPAK